ncbi:adenosylmethionine decarboxylase [Achromobacter sp. MFA1 R4]|uniref:adenosylmethionine decarboxylase n=1 Tax=Achromobacter sp. MFA1 R4 TaxID=1881016 RepID=UPI0009536C3E|nr:adenosylmethionine decarboxylase [Achromobacter sp. MFA1 R4]SIT28806.1 S-adenosylmethionine decarboxylase [Achromobacter sp. MFA1 R4]
MTGHATPGRHVLADFRGVEAGLLADAPALERQMTAAARAAGAQVLSAHFHHFGEGAGVTGVILLSESHISIHSWPEHRFAALDIFMCGAARPEAALDFLRAALAPEAVRVTTVARG